MELKRILAGLEGLKAKGDINIDIEGIENNSQNVKDNYLFIAVKGYSTDGHNYIEDAVKLGAKAILVEEGCDIKKISKIAGVTIVMPKNTREALALCANNFYGNPSRNFKLIGVTGTKGKTTTCFIARNKKCIKRKVSKHRYCW